MAFFKSYADYKQSLMGLYNRDYGRADQWNDNGGWSPAGGNAPWSLNTKLIVTMAVVYLIQVIFLNPKGGDFTSVFVLYEDWYQKPWQVYQLLTYGFLHSTTNIFHLAFNAFVLFFFGRAVEERYGSREYLAFFLIAVIFSGLCWSLSELLFEGSHTLLGASGAISGVMLLFALNFPKREIHFLGAFPIPALVLVGVILYFDVVGALSRSGNVAYSAHLSGALFGYLYFSNRWHLARFFPEDLSVVTDVFKPKPKLRIHREDDQSNRSSADEEKLDRILKKINQTGMDSLSRSEKAFLEKESKKRQKQN